MGLSTKARLFYMGILLLLILGLWFQKDACGQHVPSSAYQYKSYLRSQVVRIWGLRQEISIFAAQIHQESSWRPNAQSPYAAGLGQFTPATAEDMNRIDAELRAISDVFNPRWSIRALVLYDYRLYNLFDSVSVEKDRWAFTLASYNGGYGWIIKERKKTQEEGFCRDLWFEHTEMFCIRADWACEENRMYPKKILETLLPIYEFF